VLRGNKIFIFGLNFLIDLRAPGQIVSDSCHIRGLGSGGVDWGWGKWDKMGGEKARLTFLNEGGTGTPCGTEKQRPVRQAGE
jgi:hypothetical protein